MDLDCDYHSALTWDIPLWCMVTHSLLLSQCMFGSVM